jgi:hypothetical protein
LSLDFFHSLAGLGCRGDASDDYGANPSTSPRDLFLPAQIFELLDGDAFILQVQGVFTRIRSGAMPVANGGVALGIPLSHATTVLAGWRRRAYQTDLFERLLLRRMKTPKGLWAYL